MATATKLDLTEQETERVNQLCAKFDPEDFFPEWMKQRGESADWEAYLRMERHELRSHLEVALLTRRAFAQLDGELRLRLFHDAADEIVKSGPDDDTFQAVFRVQELFTLDECDRLNAILHDNCTIACRRALYIESDPQMIAS